MEGVSSNVALHARENYRFLFCRAVGTGAVGNRPLRQTRGVMLIYKALRYYCKKYEQTSSYHLQSRRSRPLDKCHIDEVFPIISSSLSRLSFLMTLG